jgi:hypothetical protein
VPTSARRLARVASRIPSVCPNSKRLALLLRPIFLLLQLLSEFSHLVLLLAICRTPPNGDFTCRKTPPNSRQPPQTLTAMLSLSSLLNPAPPGPPISRFLPSPASSSPSTPFADDSSFLERHMLPKQKMPKDAAVFTTKSKPKGSVNFYPFERLDDASLRQVRNFQVYPLGRIQEYCRHIPYNSGKKDFFEKTGRECFEGRNNR